MKMLHYNFNKSAWISDDLYKRVWAVDNLWTPKNKDLLNELYSVLGTDVYEINCDPDEVQGELFEIDLRDSNGNTKEFNDSMKYMLEALPDCIIREDRDGLITVDLVSEKAITLIMWLYETDCFNVNPL